MRFDWLLNAGGGAVDPTMNPDTPDAWCMSLEQGMPMGLREESQRVEAGQGCKPMILLEGCQGPGWARLHRHMRVNLPHASGVKEHQVDEHTAS